MKAGTFNFNDYLEKLNEESTDKGFITGTEKDGILMPEENKKSYDWLKKEYQKGKTEVKVEMHIGNAKFEPGYALQTDLKSVKDFKPGMFGNVKTGDTGKKGGPTPPVEEPNSPNKQGDISAEQKKPKGNNETADKPEPAADKSPKGQQMQLNIKSKKKDPEEKKKEEEK